MGEVIKLRTRCSFSM